MDKKQIQGNWIATINALDANDNPKALYFADKSYKDREGRNYLARMEQPAVITVCGNDGGLLPQAMGESSIGEIVLKNKDGSLNYLANYALDGRDCTLQLVSPQGVVTTWFKGIVTRLYEKEGKISLTLKTLTEALDTPLNLSRYAGTGGVEGLTTDIMGNIKPRVYGTPKNMTPVLCYAALGIYQVSDLTTCTVTAVFDKGSAITLGTTHTSLANLLATNPAAGTFDRFQGYFRLGTMTVQQITCEATDSAVLAGDVFKKIADSVQFSSGVRAIGEKPALINDALHEYQLSVSATCVIDDVFSNGSRFSYDGVTYASLTALRSATIPAGKFGRFQGSLRVSPFVNSEFPYNEIPLGVMTCNATDSAVDYATTYSIITNSTAVSKLNAVGSIGLYVNSDTKVKDLLDKIALSVGGFWWIGDSLDNTSYNSNMLNAGLYEEPSATADFPLYPHRIDGHKIRRTQTGIGSNGVPIYSVLARYARNETVQTDVLGATTQTRKAQVEVESLIQESVDLNVKKRHPQATRLEFDSLLISQTEMQAVTDRLLAFFKKRCDMVELVYFFEKLPRFTIFATPKLFYPALDYQNGVNFRLASYEIDVQLKRASLKLMGYKP